MRDYLCLGPVPAEEDCAQVGSPDYDRRSRLEAEVFIEQLRTMFPGAEFKPKLFPHDFGSYREVVVFYDDDDPEQVRLVFNIEENLPSHWTEESKAKLAE